MKRLICIMLTAGLVVWTIGATDFEIEKREDIRKTMQFQNPTKPGKIQVDNIFGAISVSGYKGKDIQLHVLKTIKAEDKQALQRALKEVKLDITPGGNTIDLYVNGPFRQKEDDKRQCNWKDPGYQVHYDFEIKVPHQTHLLLKTITEGDIEVTDIEGEFDIHNVNGKITIQEIAGAGTAHTVNGRIKVTFSRNPQSQCSFKTINGDLDISFRENLSADFRLKTFTGDIYSDFPVTYLPLRPAKAEYRDGKYIYKSDRFVGVQTGNGGPELKMDTFNGDILINKRNSN